MKAKIHVGDGNFVPNVEISEQQEIVLNIDDISNMLKTWKDNGHSKFKITFY